MLRGVLTGQTGKNQVAVGLLAAALAAVCYGFSQFLARQVVTTQAPAMVAATFAPLVGTIVLASLSTKNMVQDRRAPKKAILIMALAGIAASAGVAFNYLALSRAPVVVVAPLTASNPLIVLILVHFFLRRMERVTLRTWLGALLVIGGVILITWGSARG